jgi:methylated-DNA-protein-cysteine methyltransferase-like protein
VTTYGDLAAALGRPRAARQVGFALARAGEGCPWHRVINAAGTISGRGDLPRVRLQRSRLEREGHAFDGAGRLVGFASRRYRFPTEPGEADLAWTTTL